MLHFTNFRKKFGENIIVDIPSFQLRDGVYWLKGENGSGKTTLLKAIAGLIPFSGTISVNDIDIKRRREDYKSIVNYAEAEPIYPGFLRGSDLVRFYSETKKGTREQVQALSDVLGIGSYVDNMIGTYSSGMAKKLSLALAFIGNPKLILLDEPMITLDSKSLASLQELIAEHSRKGVSFLVTSHQELNVPGITMSALQLANKTILQV
ncbi:MAG: hypothetical protein K0Q79_2804 [Flavipsychrobacter sp.]|jgi:ABC-2 type transport system ATP-binding protein|nr:hypothetical protein [Flavipsychrobacter sp.]